MITTESKRGVLALMAAHCAGMLDLVALPVWVGTLMASYAFDPQQAGGLATLFLIGASLASVVSAPRFTRHVPRRMVVGGFGLAAVAFLVAALTRRFVTLAPLHLAGGLAAGLALSFTHGTIGRAANPHRLFGLMGFALGVFGMVFLGATPGIVAHYGGASLFVVFALIMAGATLLAGVCYPAVLPRADSVSQPSPNTVLPRLGPAVWCAIVAIALMSMTQAMTLSFFARIGMVRGFGTGGVTLALVIYGVVTLFPAPLAALLERRVSGTRVVSTMPVLQAVFALVVTQATGFGAYAIAGALMAFTIIFVHTFAFGLLARWDPSARAVAGTPAMLMIGSAIAPFLGGTLVKWIGIEAIGYAAVVLVAGELVFFNVARGLMATRSGDTAPAARSAA
jgi:predicted MFS family arabinose efflux permease